MIERLTSRLPTEEIAAAPSRGAPYPASLVDCHLPSVDSVLLQGVRGEVADLYFVKMGLKVTKCHPATKWKDTVSVGGGGDGMTHSFVCSFIHSFTHLTNGDRVPAPVPGNGESSGVGRQKIQKR